MSYRKKGCIEAVCSCGCGEIFISSPRKRNGTIQYKKYITGHRRLNIRPQIKCACGCDIIFTSKPRVSRGAWGISKYIQGHDPKYRKHMNNKGWCMTYHGYKDIYIPNHPFATQRGYVREHRLVMEKHLGRYLEPHEEIHHINGVRDDNKLENLIIITKAKHTFLHNAKFTKKQIREIRTRLAKGETGTSIAKKYKVAHSTIYNIKNKKAY